MTGDGPVALVTGAGGMRSIGRAVALRLAADGYDVGVTDVDRPPERVGPDERAAGWHGLDAVAAEVEATGRRALPVVCDLTDASAVAELVTHVAGRLGPIDVLVNTARAFTDPEVVPTLDLTVEAWDHVHAVNARGPLLTSQLVARAMVERGAAGRIVNVSSLASHKPLAGGVAYCSSKAALDMLTRVLALELGPHGIRVNAVNPGTVATNRVSLVEARMAAEAGVTVEQLRRDSLARQAADIALRRVAEPDDVADVVAFLVGDDSRHVTGQCIDVTGGPADG